MSLSYAFRWVVTFIILTVLVVLAALYLLDIDLPLNGIILFSAFPSLLLTIFLGWMDAVYIKKRQPGLEK